MERMLAQHPEARVEMDKIEQTLENVAQAYAVAPPADLKARILSEINRPADLDSLPGAAGGPWGSRLLFWAAGVLLLAATWLFYQNNTLRDQNKAQAVEMTALTQQLADCNAINAQKERIYALLSNTQTVKLNMQKGPTTVPVYFNQQRKEVAFNLSELQDRNDGQYYQLWVIDSKGIKSLGMAHKKTVDDWVRTDVKDLSKETKIFAISLEDGPDEKDKPTMPPEMLVKESGE